MRTVAYEVIRQLKQWGVTHLFGIPGKAVVPLILAAEDQGIRFVLTRHEAGAGYMAAGYALRTGKLGVAVGTSGPGGTNLLTAAGQAGAFHAPVLFLTGHPSAQKNGIAQGQDSSIFGTDLVRMFEPVTRFSGRVDRSDQTELMLRHALEQATCGRKGPVHLSVPLDVLTQQIEPMRDIELPQYEHPVSPRLDEVAEWLGAASKAVIFAGKGVHLSGAYEELRELSERYRIPVMTTPGGKGTFPETHPLSLGAFGLGGTPASAAYCADGLDLLVVLGSSLSDMSLAGWAPSMTPGRIVQFDVDGRFAGKSLRAPTLWVQGDIRANLRKLLGSERMSTLAIPQSAIANWRTAERQLAVGMAEGQSSVAVRTGTLSAAEAMTELRRQLPSETILFGDDGSHTFYAIRNFEIRRAGTFYFDDVFGAMGHAIGLAIGAKAGRPEERIVCLTGDGCFMMHGTEIATAVNEGIPLLFIVMNNGRLDMVEKGMARHLGRSEGTVYQVPMDACKFAEALGAAAYRCESVEQMKTVFPQALREPGCVVVELMLDPDEVPPTMNRG